MPPRKPEAEAEAETPALPNAIRLKDHQQGFDADGNFYLYPVTHDREHKRVGAVVTNPTHIAMFAAREDVEHLYEVID